MSLPPSDAFKAWHAKRAAGIIKNAETLADEYIKDGFSDSGPTRSMALFKAFESVDGTGWDAWQAGRADLIALVQSVHKAKGRYHSQIAMCNLYDACNLPNTRPAK